MKKKNLKLSDLKVQSFVTSLNDDQLHTLKGGDATNNPACNSIGVACRTVAHNCATHISGNCYTFNGCANTVIVGCATLACE